jgi:diguanylate cyclase (GGDEF)-like protein
MKILVVEDTRINLKVVSRYLERLGMTPIPAENGTRAVELFHAERPDMVLLDVVLPDFDGFEVARRIRSAEKPGDWAPIIFLTSMTEDSALEKGIAAGGDDYLYKPVSEVVLGAKIRAMQRIIQMRTSLVVLTKKLDNANRELRRLSSLDWLTEVPNRRHFEETLAREWRRSMRQGSEFSVLVCDIDRFKGYNDAFGHPAGDQCLRNVAHALSDAMVRGGDFVARYGGEEFAAILPDTPLEGAKVVAERMRAAVEALAIPHPASENGHVTASFGVASGIAMPEADPLKLIELADKALYEAKAQGRNRICTLASMDAIEN